MTGPKDGQIRGYYFAATRYILVIKIQKAAMAAALSSAKDSQAMDDSRTGEQPLPPAPPTSTGAATMEIGSQPVSSDNIKQEPAEHSSESVSCDSHMTKQGNEVFMHTFILVSTETKTGLTVMSDPRSISPLTSFSGGEHQLTSS